jgi:predicted dehydrogenase
MKKVAVVGFGFMGRAHCAAWKKRRGAKVVAVCDSNLAQITAKVEGNIAGAADGAALDPGVKVFADFGGMLAAGGIDIVDLTLPTPLHAKLAVAALEAGCHVLCEKPMALSLKDCDAMIAAAEKADRRLLIAHCVRFFPEYARLRSFVESGRYGKVVAAEFTRYMAVPKWSPKGGSWLLDETKSGGLYFDAHIHDADYITSLFGMPGDVISRCRVSERGYVDHQTTIYGYPDMVVTSSSSFAASDSLVWDAAARVFFEKATVYTGGASRSGAMTVYPEGGKPFSPKLPALNGYESEIAYFLDCVEGRAEKPLLTARDAREAGRLVTAERRSAELGRRVRL